MKPEEHKQIISDVLSNLADQGKVSGLLTNISEDYGRVIAETENAQKLAAKLTADNESLRAANMALFLKVGTQVQKEKEEQPKEDQPLTFDQLFDEKGELK